MSHFSIWQPSAILDLVRVCTTHKEYLVVFILLQNLVEIGAAVSIICMILDFARLAENAYIHAPKIGVLGT